MTAGTGSAGTNGFLFCDLRGYTAFVEHHGDQAAADLLAAYRALVRTAIASHAGAEIRTEGDSVYVVFPAASAAVEAGLEIVAAAATASTKDAPIRVGVGIHAGETVATTEGLVGGAVNIAARVCAKAQAGEVLVTDTVRALTRTYLPYRYTGLGTQQLKGIAGGIPLYRVEAVPSSGRARFRRQLGARKGRVLVLAGLVVIALVAATGVYALNRPPDCLTLPASTKDVVVKIDPARNCVVAVYQVGYRPASVIAADGLVWVANVEDQTISIVDPTTGLTRATGANGMPIGLASGAASIYVLTLTNGVQKIPTALKRIQDHYQLPTPSRAVTTPGYMDIAFSLGRVWITNSITGDVQRVRIPGGGAALHIEDPGVALSGPSHGPDQASLAGIGPLAAAGGTVWIADPLNARLYRVDGFGASPVAVSIDPAHGGPVDIAASTKAEWLLHEDGFLTRIDAMSGGTVSARVVTSGSSVAAVDQAVWVTDLGHGAVASIDPASSRVLGTLDVGGRPGGIAIADDGAVWVTIQAP